MKIPRLLAAGVLSAALATPLLVTPAQAAPSPDAAVSGSHRGGDRDHRSTAKAVVPTLEARATLSADYLAPGPASGAKASPGNGRQGPWAGQVIPGFSAMIDNGDGTFLAMPDNGFGSKANSADYLLRLYKVAPKWETAHGGRGQIKVKGFISLRDPKKLAGFDIVNKDSAERLLTGADFDVESVVRQPDGTFWIGEEFGPYLLHFSADGVLLQAPVPFVDGKSPSNPTLKPGETANVRSSKGFEAMASSKNGRFLYPMTEGYLANEKDKRRRVIYQFDTRAGKYTGKTWSYEADTDDTLLGDAFAVSDSKFLVLERDDFWGPQSVTKRVYSIDLHKTEKDGYLAKNLVVDLLKIDNPGKIGMRRDKSAYGVGTDFSFPMQSTETVVQLKDGRLLFANDNNYPGNDARYPGRPDDTEMLIVDLKKKQVPTNGDHILFSHRGASGYRPEHTLAAYELGINQCADYIEPDLVSTKDGVLVDRHENEISGTTDVATRPEFAGRKTTKVVDGTSLTGWFTEDFTLAELRTLRAKERLPKLRPQNTKFDGLYQVPTFEEVIDLARHSRTCSGKPVGIIPEIKHSTYFASIGLKMEDKVVAALKANGLDRKKAPVVIQSFEVGNLKELSRKTKVQLVQLIDCSGGPADLTKQGVTYQQMVTPQGLRDIKRYADNVGFCNAVMIPVKADGTLGEPTSVIRDAHRAGLKVTGWTFRAENDFLPLDYRNGTDPAAHGDLVRYIRTFLAAGLDNVFTDNPDLGAEAIRGYRPSHGRR
ncbi:esterase-like activity of phytase family protein [Nigerium massiliense]|uniref:esterase-like activity of phytase family protein n=1 Tax=Nigerium massiliense TaxID=1522317 RepID=UPI00058AE636|nr:esterase-like activity of phytase family protein [Nigerium massiliense]